MIPIQSLVSALVSLLEADSDVNSLLSGRIFGGEIPNTESTSMPRKSVAIRKAPGASLMAGSFIEHDTQTIDFYCYGETLFEAEKVQRYIYPVLQQLQRRTIDNTLIHWANPIGGGVTFRDPDVAWPTVVQSFQVFYAHGAVS